MRSGSELAARYDLEFHGTLRVLQRFQELEFISSTDLRRHLLSLRQRGMRLPWATVDALLMKIGEETATDLIGELRLLIDGHDALPGWVPGLDGFPGRRRDPLIRNSSYRFGQIEFSAARVLTASRLRSQLQLQPHCQQRR